MLTRRNIDRNLIDDLRLGRIPAHEFPHLPFMDEYRLVRCWGHGAMGRVYLAHDTLLDRPVAIKFLSGENRSVAARERLLFEARVLARVSHPNVVTIFRIGDVFGHFFLVSEFVRGRPLSDVPKPLPWQRVLAIGIEMARGLAATHRMGVLHRDIKPANTILAANNTVKLIDFGLAKLLDEPCESEGNRCVHTEVTSKPDLQDADSEETVETSWPFSAAPDWVEEIATSSSKSSANPVARAAADTRAGTPRYMAPEIWRAEPASTATDIYGLGAVLYELTSGIPPHSASSMDELSQRVQNRDAAPLSSVSPGASLEFCAMVDRCLHRNPEKRFSDGEALRLALERLAHKRPLPLQNIANPYRGLQAFEGEHALLFFGREREVDTVMNRLRLSGSVLITGDSGVGKSSLCRAGVLPRIAAGELSSERRWAQIVLVPGPMPLRSIALALAPILGIEIDVLQVELKEQPLEVLRRIERFSADKRGMIFLVDQLEELVTQGDPSEVEIAAMVIARLVHMSMSVRVLMTARADFLTRLVALPQLGTLLEQALYFLPPLTKVGLRSAIVEPAEALGYHFASDATIHELVEGAQCTLGGLPLLQFTLSLLWDARDVKKSAIPESAIETMGGVSGALGRYADGVLRSFPPARRDQVLRMLALLVSADGVRLRKNGQDLEGVVPDALIILERLVAARLLVVRELDGTANYELAHEALSSGWSTLRDVLSKERDERVIRERLLLAASEWQRLDGAEGALWGNVQLAEVFERARIDMQSLPQQTQRFLKASEKRVRAERRGRLFRYGLALTIPLLGLFVFAQVKRAEQARVAEEEQRRLRQTAETLELATRSANLAQTPGRETIALSTAIRVIAPFFRRGEPIPPTALFALSAAIHAGRQSMPLRGHRDSLWTSFFSPDGRFILTASGDNTARLWDAETGQLVRIIEGHTAVVRTAVFFPGGARIVTASEDGTTKIWDTATGRAMATFAAAWGPLSAAYPAPNGKDILVASFSGKVAILAADDMRKRFETDGYIGRASAGNILSYQTFSPDSRFVAIGKTNCTVAIHATDTGTVARVLPAIAQTNESQIVYAWYSPAGDRLAVRSSATNDFGLFNPTTGDLIALLSGHTYPSLATFSATGRYLATTGNGTIRLWDSLKGTALHGTVNAKSRLSSMTFSPDERYLFTTGEETSARLWSVPEFELIRDFRGHAHLNTFGHYSPAGDRVTTASWDGTARIWSPWAGAHSQQLFMQKNAFGHTIWAPDGRHIAMASPTCALTIFDRATLKETVALEGGTMTTEGVGVAFSPDSKILAVGCERHLVRLWDVSAQRVIRTLDSHTEGIEDLAFSGDGALLLSVGHDRRAILWDTHRGAIVAQLEDHANPLIFGALSQDGQRAATAQVGGKVDVFALPQGRKLFSLTDDGGRICPLDFSPDGRQLILGGTRPRIVDSSTGQSTLELEGHLDAVTAASFSRDGRSVLTASADQTIRVWDAERGTVLQVLSFDDRNFHSVAFSPDGQQILLASEAQHSINFFPAQTQELMRTACGLLHYQPEWADVANDCQSIP